MNRTLFLRFLSVVLTVTSLGLPPPALAQAPAPASNVSAVALGARKMQITWTDNATDETGYVVERSTAPGGPSWIASAALPSNTVSYDDSAGLQGNTTYYYRVKALNGSGETFSTGTSGTTQAYPTSNHAPDALGVLPDYVGVYYSDSISETINSSGDADNDVSKDGEFAVSSAGTYWFKRHTPDSPTGAQPLDEVDVYWKDGNGDWVYQTTLEPPLAAGSNSGFGTSVTASGSRVYIGAPGALNTSSVASGVVYEYGLDGANLTLLNTIEPPGGTAGDQFGFSLAVDGTRLLVGATGRDQTVPFAMTDAGAVFFYEFNSSWSLVHTAWSLAGHDNGRFGFSVALRDRVLAIGAPYEQGWITVGNTTYVMGEVGTVHVGQWDRPSELLGFYNLFSLFAPVQAKVEGLSASHFGWSVAVDDMMRVAVSMPDSSWVPADNMSGWDSGMVMLLNWNGSIDNYSFGVNAFSHDSLAAGDRFGEHLETAGGEVDFGISTAIREPDNKAVHYFAVAAVQVQPGSLGTPFRVGDVFGMDEDADPLNFEVPSLNNPNGTHFYISPNGQLQAEDSLQWVADGLQPLTLSVFDDRGGVSSRTMTLEVSGASPDTDADRLPDWWEIQHFGDLDEDGLGDLDSDGLTNAQEQPFGSDPLSADADNDGASDAIELAAGSNPNVADTDSDGIPDGPEITAGLDPKNPTDALQDLDGDGFSNLTAYTRSWPFDAALTQLNDLDEDRILDVIEAHWTEVYPLLASPDPSGKDLDPLSDPDEDSVLTFEELQFGLNPALAETTSGTPDWDIFSAAYLVAYGFSPSVGEPDDADEDGLPNEWEYFYEFNLRDPSTATLDPDGDQLSNEEEFFYGTSPVVADSDEDGLPDNWELQHELNPNNADDEYGDPDGDGVSNAQEFANGTNPQSSADADSDGMPDDWEIANAGRLAVTPGELRAFLQRGQTSAQTVYVRNDTAQSVNYAVELKGHSLPDYAVDDTVPFIWEDISSTGQHLASLSGADDATHPISLNNFTFPLYGSRHSVLHVSSNGIVTVGSPDASYSNSSLPNASAPAGLIAALWDDLNPGTGGNIYYKEEASRVIIQYQGVRKHSSADTYTFQIVLNDQGKIEFRYQSISGSANSCTVGIQSPSRSYGKEVVFDDSYLQSGLAIVIEPDPNTSLPGSEFLTVSPLAGSIASGATAALDADFFGLSLPSGAYTADIEITTTDPVAPSFSVPATLTVSDQPTTVTIVSPTAGAEFTPWNSIRLRANAANAEFQIETVKFVANGTTLAEGYSEGNDTFVATWYPGGIAGTYQITAVATTSSGHQQISAPITVIVSTDDDNDQMPDAWETAHGLDPLDYGDGNSDFDGDGIMNRHEFLLGFKPNSINSDGDSTPDAQEDRDADGLFDWWELKYFESPVVALPAADPDDDGLTNLQEQAADTDPNARDSDYDSLPDGWEVTNGLDPNDSGDGGNVDSDGDGLSNYQEYQLGFNPQDQDSDNNGTNDGQQDADLDGLPDWWEFEHFGSPTVATPTDDADNDNLSNLQEFTEGTRPSDSDSDNDSLPDGWEISNGLNPLNSSDGYSTDTDGDGLTNFQEYELGFNPNSQDTDNNGIPDALQDSDSDGLFDWWEFKYSGSATAALPSADLDGDNLTNLQELAAGTHPGASDTDYDGLEDGWEVANSLDPLDPSDGYWVDSDGDGLTNQEELELGFNAQSADSDNDSVPDSLEDRDADGLPDIWEHRHFGDPTSGAAGADGDSDGLSNLGEFQAGTLPDNGDSDGDSISDGWEVLHNLDPVNSSDATGDADNDGINNVNEFVLGLDPNDSDSDDDGQNDLDEDSDNDGLTDSWEIRYFPSLTAANATGDADGDGLTNLQEHQISTNPVLKDTDGDLLEDGWENQYGLDPNDATGANGKDGDADGDGLNNLDEVIYGCDPNNADTDGDGTADGAEVGGGGHPNDPTDGGNPPPPDQKLTMKIIIGDPSGSHSERWAVEVKDLSTGKVVLKQQSSEFGELSAEQNSVFSIFRKDRGYEFKLIHLDTDPEKLQEDEDGVFYPDYDWALEVSVKDEQGNFVDIRSAPGWVIGDPWDPQTKALWEGEGAVPILVGRGELTYPWEGDPDRTEQYQTHVASKRVVALPVEVEITHVEPGTDALSPTTVLRDEIVNLRIKIPVIDNQDREIDLDVTPNAMRTQTLGARGSTLMFDFGKIDQASGGVTPITASTTGGPKDPPFQVTLKKDQDGTNAPGEIRLKAVFNKTGDSLDAAEGKLKISIKSQGMPTYETPEITVKNRIRKYGIPYVGFANHDPNQHDTHFLNAANHWGTHYNRMIDSVDRLKAISVAESNLGAFPSRPGDIMSIGHPGDKMLATMKGTVNQWDLDASHPKKPADLNYRKLRYSSASYSTPSEAIKWGTLWLYVKGFYLNRSKNPNWTWEKRNMPPFNSLVGNEEPYDIFTGWVGWDVATARYNGGGDANNPTKIEHALYQGLHYESSQTREMWPILSNKAPRKRQ